MAAQVGHRTQRRRNKPQALAPTRERRLAASSQRQCVACRRAHPTDELVCLVPIGIDAKRRSYLCAARACIVRMADTVHKSSARDFVAELRLLACRRLVEALGLARRQNQIVAGTERLLQLCAREQAELLCAQDAAPRSLEKFRRAGAQLTHLPLTAAELGHAIGMMPIVAVTLMSGRHAQQAAHWLRVWYEAPPTTAEHAEQRAQQQQYAGHSKRVATRCDAIDDGIEVVR